MTWFKVDDSLAFHPKVMQAGNTAMGLWVRAGSWASQQLTDGFVPVGMLAAFGASQDDASALVEAGLWSVSPGGWTFHEWGDRQPSRAKVEERRAKTAERVAKWRANHPKGEPFDLDTPLGNAVTYAVTNGVTNGVRNSVSNTAPDPTRPDIETYVGTSPDVGGAGGETSQPKAAPRKRARTDTGHRLPDNWVPEQKIRDDLRQQYPGLPDTWWRLEHEKFCNHFHAATGRNGRKTDWGLTFRNWIHEAARRDRVTRMQNGRPVTTTSSPAQERVEEAQRLKRGKATPPPEQIAITGVTDGMG